MVIYFFPHDDCAIVYYIGRISLLNMKSIFGFISVWNHLDFSETKEAHW